MAWSNSSIITQKSWLIRSRRPCRYSQPSSASKAVASPYWARVAWPGTDFTWAFRPRRNTAASSSLRRGRIRSAFSAWDAARTRAMVAWCSPFPVALPWAQSQVRTSTSNTASPMWARPMELMARSWSAVRFGSK